MSLSGTKPTLGEHRIYVGLPPKVEVQATRVVTQIDRIADENGDVRFQGQSRRSKRKPTLSRLLAFSVRPTPGKKLKFTGESLITDSRRWAGGPRGVGSICLPLLLGPSTGLVQSPTPCSAPGIPCQAGHRGHKADIHTLPAERRSLTRSRHSASRRRCRLLEYSENLSSLGIHMSKPLQ